MTSFVDCRANVRVILGTELAAARPVPKPIGDLKFRKADVDPRVNDPHWEVARDELEHECGVVAQQVTGQPIGTKAAEFREEYVRLAQQTIGNLRAKCGDFFEQSVADAYLAGNLAAAQVVKFEPTAEMPRDRIRGRLYAVLRDYPDTDDATVREWVRGIERGVYNSIIQHCTESDAAYRRSWDCPEFVALYSTRAGSVLANVDPHGSIVRAHGPVTIDLICAGVFTPEEIGGASERVMCPAASQNDVDLIELRSRQVVVQKVSQLYKCPMCHARNHTYRSIQMRGTDEAATIMCTCLKCGEHYEGH